MSFELIAMIGAAIAVIANAGGAYSLRHAHSLAQWRRILWWSAALSLVYVFAWGSLVLIEDIDRGYWSRVVTPFSAVSFITVWSWPGIMFWIQRTPDERSRP